MATNVSGKVGRIYVTDHLASFFLIDLPSPSTPKDGYFHILKSNQSYNALYALALSAAINRYTLNVKTAKNITSTEYADVIQLWIDF